MPTNSPSSAAPVSRLLLVLGAAAFAAAATLNAGGYRYGAADQAFYIPAVLHQLDPSLFPRDWAMLGAQGRFFFVDEIFATLVRGSGWALPVWFALAQVTTLGVFYYGACALGRQVVTTPWALTAWLAALTLRHRIARTGANTLEGYFHPRVLVFAIGMVALADLLRGRRWRPVVLTLASAALHPTTAALFLGIVLVALAVSDRRLRRPVLSAGTAAGVLAAVAAMAGWTPFDVTPMDATWRALVASKDYTFPTEWSFGTWATNLAGPIVILAAGAARARAGQLTARELGLLGGCLALVTGFLLSLPLVAAGVPLAVQLQTSRVFWPVETVAILYLVWWLVDRPARVNAQAATPRLIAALLIAVSLSRAIYVGFIESPGRETFAFGLPHDDWAAALRWVRAQTPADTYVLADPGHAWKMGTAVRIGAARDVFLEETKDVAMAMYPREAAHRIAGRIAATQGFADWTPAALRALAGREGLTVLVSPRRLDLPVLHRSGSITVYDLAADGGATR